MPLQDSKFLVNRAKSQEPASRNTSAEPVQRYAESISRNVSPVRTEQAPIISEIIHDVQEKNINPIEATRRVSFINQDKKTHKLVGTVKELSSNIDMIQKDVQSLKLNDGIKKIGELVLKSNNNSDLINSLMDQLKAMENKNEILQNRINELEEKLNLLEDF